MTTTLEAITTNFRRFTQNQVLTEGHLNQIVDYFDDQIRLSRTCLSGVGIVCGFQVSCDESTSEITITQGVGVTTDGDLMHLFETKEDGTLSIDLESITYKGYQTYDNSQAQYRPFFYRGVNQITLRELTTTTSGEGVRPLSNLATLKDMVVLLYRETYIEDADLCTTLGCDNQGESRVVNHRVLLVSKTDAAYIISHDPTIQKTNYGKLYYELPEVVMNKVVATPDIFDTYADLKQSFFDAITEDNTVQKLIDGYTTLLNELDAPQLLSAIQDKLAELFVFSTAQIPDDFQYRYDALKDQVDTYNEIKQLLLDIDVSDCCAGYEDFPKHLMLGEVEKSGPCYECRHGFYKSPILAGLTSTTCDSCAPIELDYDIGDAGDDPICEGSVDSDGNRSYHIVFVMDESGSFSRERENVRNALNAYVESVRDTNTFISLIPMSSNRNDNSLFSIYKRATDPATTQWIQTYATRGGDNDDWKSGLLKVQESILNDPTIPNPDIVITINDETSFLERQIDPISAFNVLLTPASENTKLFLYILDNNPVGQINTNIRNIIPPTSVPSVDGETDLDTADYFLAQNFRDLEAKIRNLNEILINSNIFCPETTEDEVVIDRFNQELAICYSSSKTEQRLFTLIKRSAQQLTNYNADYNFIKITPTMDLGVLSKKAIPFYYNVGEKLIEYWDFDKTIRGTQKTNLSYHDNLLAIKKPLEFCIDHDFYRVEGHLGRNYTEVVQRINTIKKANSLGFNVVALPIENVDIIGGDFKSFYLNRNFGLEHKAGVPPGGTLVLFYLQNSQSDSQFLVSEADVAFSEGGEFLETAAFEIDPRTVNPIVADFCLPYLCCDENEVEVSLPDEVICFDDDTQPIPFDVVPRNAVVRADVPAGLDGGVIRNSDGTYSFDARRVSPELHGFSIRFIVNNQNANFGVKVYEKPELGVTHTVAYSNNGATATVTFTVTGGEINTINEFRWDFGDGSPISNTQPNVLGQVVKVYSLPVNQANTVSPVLTVTRGFCNVNVPIESITFDRVPYYYGYTGDVRRLNAGDDDILSMSIGDLL